MASSSMVALSTSGTASTIASTGVRFELDALDADAEVVVAALLDGVLCCSVDAVQPLIPDTMRNASKTTIATVTPIAIHPNRLIRLRYPAATVDKGEDAAELDGRRAAPFDPDGRFLLRLRDDSAFRFRMSAEEVERERSRLAD